MRISFSLWPVPGANCRPRPRIHASAPGGGAERDGGHGRHGRVELDDGHVVEHVARAVGVAPARVHREARAVALLGADEDAGDVRERGVHDAVPAVRTRSGATSVPPQPRDVGEPRHGLGGDGLPADHRARRRGGGESDQHGEQQVRVMDMMVSVDLFVVQGVQHVQARGPACRHDRRADPRDDGEQRERDQRRSREP